MIVNDYDYKLLQTYNDYKWLASLFIIRRKYHIWDVLLLGS